jgi:DNA adenine methylase
MGSASLPSGPHRLGLCAPAMPPWLPTPPTSVEPFVRWPGGKRWAVPQLLPLARAFLSRSGRYFEPFLGGGALFFALRPTASTLSDVNSELIDTYQIVRQCPQKLAEHIREMRVSRAVFEAVKASRPSTQFERAVRFLYLNRVAFSGIYRLNRHGIFNVPYDGTRGTDLLWKSDLLERAGAALDGAALSSEDFEETMSTSGSGDVVYCDPAYTVSHNNNCFVRYNEKNFSWPDQERLAGAAMRAATRGATVLVTNADHESVRSLYDGWPSISIARRTRLAPNPARRGDTTELLVVLATGNNLRQARARLQSRHG